MPGVSGHLWTAKWWSYDSVPGGNFGGSAFIELLLIAHLLNRICRGLDRQWILYIRFRICGCAGTDPVLLPQFTLIRPAGKPRYHAWWCWHHHV